MVAKREKTYEGSLPLVVYGAVTAAIIAVITLLHGAAIYIPTFLWSLGLMNVDPQIYRHDLVGRWATPRSRSTWPRWWPSGTCSARSPSARWC